VKRPSLNKLRAFDAAARHENFRTAAEELHLTQGAVAQQVRSLEEELAQKLFSRHARGLHLTENGRAYAREIRRALEIVDNATRQIAPTSQRIVLSVPPSVAAKWLLPKLADFREINPDIDLVTQASEKISVFNADAVDLAIRIGTPPFADLEHHFLADKRLSAVTQPALANKLLSGSPHFSCAQDFSSLPLLFDSHNHWELLFRSEGLATPSPQLQFNHSSLAIDAAREGQGIALVPTILARHGIETGELVSLFEAPALSPSNYYIVYPAGHSGEHNVRLRVIDWLLKEGV